MKRPVNVLAVIGTLVMATVGGVGAAPMTPVEQTDYDKRQIHELRDVNTGEYRPHGTLSSSDRDFSPRPDMRPAPSPRYPSAPESSFRLHLPE